MFFMGIGIAVEPIFIDSAGLLDLKLSMQKVHFVQRRSRRHKAR